jgi:O-succinylbenzoate synthase
MEPRAAVETGAVVGRAARIDDRLAEVKRRVDAGASLVKLKMLPRAGDVDAVRAVREAWPGLALAVDLNGRAGPGDLDLLARLDPLDLRYVEQPFPADDLSGSAALASRLAAPMALDESITSAAAAESAIRFGAATVLNVKPARLGGPVAAAQVLRLAADHGVDAFCGGMLETGIGRAAALAVASLPACTLPTDLGPSSAYVVVDLTDPLELDGQGRLAVPAGPGIGRVPDPDRLDAVTVDRLLLAR